MKKKLKARLVLSALVLILTLTLVFIFAEGLSSKNENLAGTNDSLPTWVTGAIANGAPF